MLDAPDDIAAFTASLSDDDALRLAEAIVADQQAKRWEEVAETFPWPDRTQWPYPHQPAVAWRTATMALLDENPGLAVGARAYYETRPREFINHWCITYDPRNASRSRPAKLPFLTFPRQDDMIEFLQACIRQEESGLIEKSRDMGASWVACAFSVWLWLFMPGAAIGWGSRKEMYVDLIGDPKSIFEKIRMIVRELPTQLLPTSFSPGDHMTFMKFINPENDATITGEAGDNIGRGGRSLIYFKDESAHYARPESIEAALGDNTDVQIDFSSVNGLGNVFHRRRESGYIWTGKEEMRDNEVAVFIMDWSDHPAKTQAWYDGRKAKAEREGLLHKFKQEVDRDYASSVAGVIIPAEWVKSAIDAHEVLGFDDSGGWVGALDVADGDSANADLNAYAFRKGVILKETDSWHAPDVGASTRRFIGVSEGKGPIELEYDSIGVGAGVKSEANRLGQDGKLSPHMRLVPWNAGLSGASLPNADRHLIADDYDSPLNKDFYANLKAQGWWELRLRFERTHAAVTAKRAGEEPTFDPDTLISLPSGLPQLQQIQKELSQATFVKNTQMKLVVDKSPEGTRSPNLADAIVMAFHPVDGLKPVISIAKDQFSCPPFKIPAHFKKGYAMKVEGQRVTTLWGAWDDASDILYFTTEYVREYAEIGVHALAIASRGKWIPGIFDCDETNLKQFDEMMRTYVRAGLGKLSASDRAVEAGIADLQQRISTGRCKAFSTCSAFFTDYRNFRRDGDGKLVGGGLMDCARLLARPEGLRRMIVEPPSQMLNSNSRRNLYV